MTAAEAIRERDKSALVSIFSGEEDLLYSRVQLPNYVRGKISREQVFLRSRDDYAEKNLELWLGESVIELDIHKKEVVTSRDRIFHYGKLLIAAGGRVSNWMPQSPNLPNIFRFQTIGDADKYRAYLESHPGKRALVVGGGFIALEYLESFLTYRLETSLVLKTDSFFSGLLTPRGNTILEDNLLRHGLIKIYRNNDVIAVEEKIDGLHAHLQDEKIIIDAIAVGVGLTRNTEIFKEAGLSVARGILVNEYLETDVSDVYAAGDIAEYEDAQFGGKRLLGMWTNAFLQGRIAGINMVSGRTQFITVPNYSIPHLGLYVAIIGHCSRASATQITERATNDSNEYELFFLENDILVGTILINRAADTGILLKAIRERRNVSKLLVEMQNPAILLKNILNT